MNTSVITFKALRRGRVVRKSIKIKHNFKELPPQDFNGITLPATTVESQVIDYLDTIDKRDMMMQYDWDIILDYYPAKKRKTNQDELEGFVTFCKPYIDLYPHLVRPFEAIISESHSVLFGKGKTNEQKFKEVIAMLNVSVKSAWGMLRVVEKIIDSPNDCSTKLITA